MDRCIDALHILIGKSTFKQMARPEEPWRLPRAPAQAWPVTWPLARLVVGRAPVWPQSHGEAVFGDWHVSLHLRQHFSTTTSEK